MSAETHDCRRVGERTEHMHGPSACDLVFRQEGGEDIFRVGPSTRSLDQSSAMALSG